MDRMLRVQESAEPCGEDEVNAFNIEITEDMTQKDVLEKVISILKT